MHASARRSDPYANATNLPQWLNECRKPVAAERCVHLRASDATGVGCSLDGGAVQAVNAMASLNIALVRCNS